MQVICLEDAAFYALIDKVVQHIKETHPTEKKWLTGEQAMQRLHITSKTTLQKLRDEDKIRFAQPHKKIIMYDADSIDEYLNKHSNKKF